MYESSSQSGGGWVKVRTRQDASTGSVKLESLFCEQILLALLNPVIGAEVSLVGLEIRQWCDR